uniref:Uncharacterized protein n=1 Tax=Leptobrachium leishanense TaxID=445787 RepID=A0A8C5LS66_9ANUR
MLNNPLSSSTSDHKPVSALLHEMSSGIMTSVATFTLSTDRKDPPDPPISLRSSHSPTKTAISHSQQSKPSPTSSPLKSSPSQSPLKSPCHHSPSRRHSPQSQQMPVAPGPTWSELLEARRRLMVVEGQRQAICALEMRVQQVQYVFLQTELRVARQREALARLVEAAGRAEVQATVHGQRIRRALRKHKPRLLACALCVPWGTRSERRSGQHARHPRCAFFQGRVPVLRGCAGGEDVGVRD